MDNFQTSHLAGQSFELEIIRYVDLVANMHIPENVEQNVCGWNKGQINLSPRLIHPGKFTKKKLFWNWNLNILKVRIKMHKKEKEKRKANRKKIKIYIKV